MFLATILALNPTITDPNAIFPGEVLNLGGGVSTTVTASTPTPTASAAAGSSSTYTVKSGDDLYSLAASYGVSLASLLAANPQIGDSTFILPGQVVTIPAGSSNDGGATITPSTFTYTIKQDDTLNALANTFRTTLAALEADNPTIVSYSFLALGESINIPGASVAATYTVKSGDTLSAIAASNGVTLAALEQANAQITNFDLVQIGQVLNLPARTTKRELRKSAKFRSIVRAML